MTTTWHQHAVAVTGSIGSGKSTVTAIFQDLGAFVVRADDLARDAVKKGSAGFNQVVDTFGRDILTPSGDLDRQALARVVFSSPDRRLQLEQITHPIVRALAESAFNQALKKKFPLYIYDCPLLYESGLDKCGFKKVIVVSASEEQCIKRVVARDGVTEEAVKKRIAAQYPIADKIKQADIVIENSGTVEELRSKVGKIYRDLTSSS